MNHESTPDSESKPAIPSEDLPELVQPPESEIDRMADEYRDVESEEELRRRQDERKSLEEMFRLSDEIAAEREARKPKPIPKVFDVPPQVQVRLDERAKEFDREWEIEESKFTPRTAIGAQLRETFEKRGLRRGPISAEEAETASLREDAEKRAEAAAKKPKHSRDVHHHRGQRSRLLWRPKNSNQRDMADADERVKTERQLRGDN